jgi:hypothetical protein
LHLQQGGGDDATANVFSNANGHDQPLVELGHRTAQPECSANTHTTKSSITNVSGKPANTITTSVIFTTPTTNTITSIVIFTTATTNTIATIDTDIVNSNFPIAVVTA